MKQEFIGFLPSNCIKDFLAEERATERLRIGMKALGESHNIEFSDKNFDEDPEPYMALRGYNIPTLSDVTMMVEYLNKMEQGHFYVDASQTWNTICVCYIEPPRKLIAEGKICPRCGSKLFIEDELDEYSYFCFECDENFYEFEV